MSVEKLLALHAYVPEPLIDFLIEHGKKTKTIWRVEIRWTIFQIFYTGKDGVSRTRPINGGPPPNPWVSGRAHIFFNYTPSHLIPTIWIANSTAMSNSLISYLCRHDVFNSSISQAHTQQLLETRTYQSDIKKQKWNRNYSSWLTRTHSYAN